MLLNKEQIKDFIPHRDPFLFLDSVERVELPGKVTPPMSLEELTLKDVVGGKAFAHYYAREDLDIFEGHFPGDPMLPGVIQMEIVAQASLFIMHPLLGGLPWLGFDCVLVKVSSAKFRNPILPGSNLSIESECTQIRGMTMIYKGRIEVEGKVMSECELVAMTRTWKK